MSAPIPKVYAAISAVTADLVKTGIAKDRSNDAQRFKFRGIDDVMNALAPLLVAHKLCILPRILSRECVERPNKSGGVLLYTTVSAAFDFIGIEDGSLYEVLTVGEAMDSGDKSTNKAMSAAMKYACLLAFCIPTEGDNDADATTHELASRTKTSPPRTAAPATTVPKAAADGAEVKRPTVRQWVDSLLLRMEGIKTETAMHDLAIDQEVVEGRAKITAKRPDLAALIQDSERAMFERVGKAMAPADDTFPGDLP